jgi:hypothetical protein
VKNDTFREICNTFQVVWRTVIQRLARRLCRQRVCLARNRISTMITHCGRKMQRAVTALLAQEIMCTMATAAPRVSLNATCALRTQQTPLLRAVVICSGTFPCCECFRGGWNDVTWMGCGCVGLGRCVRSCFRSRPCALPQLALLVPRKYQ